MKKENNAIVITSIIAGVVLLIVLSAMFLFTESTSRDVVTVTGMSVIKATPDLIGVYYTIETKGATSAEASSANTIILTSLKNTLIAQGFSEEDLKTESFNVYPNTYWENGKQKQDGYIAYHSLKIELPIEDIDKLTSVIDAGVNAGAGISYINFELTTESQNEYKAQALELAAKDAQIKADAVASGFGKRAGRLISVQVSEFGYYPWNVYSSRGGSVSEDAEVAKQAAMSISPSEEEISASVSATFKLQ